MSRAPELGRTTHDRMSWFPSTLAFLVPKMILALCHYDNFHLQCLAFFFVKVQIFNGFLVFSHHTEPVTHNIKHVQVLYKINVIVSKCANLLWISGTPKSPSQLTVLSIILEVSKQKQNFRIEKGVGFDFCTIKCQEAKSIMWLVWLMVIINASNSTRFNLYFGWYASLKCNVLWNKVGIF